MNKKLLTLLIIAGIAVIFIATGLQAATTVGDTVTIESSVIKKRTKSPDSKKPTKLVEFTHKKHHEEFKIECSNCHHDDKGQPLTALKAGDDVKTCETCHDRDKAVKKDAKFTGVYFTKATDIKAIKNAMHENCIGCHITTNIAKGDKTGKKGPAPTKCTECHVPM
jgi:mono/diheme cytochrome c family protein